MAWLRLGNRDDLERALRLLFLLPAIVLCPLVGAGMLRGQAPPIVGFVLGGAVGGAIAYALGEVLLQLLRYVWPIKPATTDKNELMDRLFPKK